jgi:hypothetical protein
MVDHSFGGVHVDALAVFVRRVAVAQATTIRGDH